MNSETELEEVQQGLRFIKNRLDRVAQDVIEWMPQKDNERHHNAVECLQSAFQVAEQAQELIAEVLGHSPRPEGRYWLQDDLSHLGGQDLLPEGERSYQHNCIALACEVCGACHNHPTCPLCGVGHPRQNECPPEHGDQQPPATPR